VKLILILVGLSAATALAQSRARGLAPILERRLETPDVVSFQVALTVAIPWAFVTAEAPLGKVALAPLDGAVKFTVRPDNSSPQGPTTWTFKRRQTPRSGQQTGRLPRGGSLRRLASPKQVRRPRLAKLNTRLQLCKSGAC